jgi:hypothetical protein
MKKEENSRMLEFWSCNKRGVLAKIEKKTFLWKSLKSSKRRENEV